MGRESILRLAQASVDRAAVEGQQADTKSLQEFTAWFETLLQVDLPTFPPADSRRIPADSTESMHTLGRFRILRRLGAGGFGIVLHAFDPLLKREVALKLPRPELLALPLWPQRVLHEAQIAATLDHPGIVPVFEVGTIGPIWFIASAYCDGLSLADYLADHPSGIPTTEAMQSLLVVAEAVHHAHTRGVLHRDIKTSNILLPKSGDFPNSEASITRPRLTDFGLAARCVVGMETSVPRLAGTPGYMAPELTDTSGGKPSIQSDIYSLGAVLFELLAGFPPSRSAAANSGEIPPLRSLRHDVDADLDAIVAKCLERHPENRYDSASQLASDLQANLEGKPVVARPQGSLRTAFRWCWRRPVLASLAIMLLLTLLFGASAVAWQWHRAETHLRIAESERARAETHLGQTERVLLDLGVAINDSSFWRELNRVEGNPQVLNAAEHYESLLLEPQDSNRSPPLIAIAHGQLALRHEANGEFAAAKKHYRACLNGWWILVRQSSDNESYRRWLTQACDWYGEFLVTHDGNPKGRYQFETDCLMDTIPVRDSLGHLAANDYAEMLLKRAEAFSKANAWPLSVQQFEACLELSRSLYKVHHDADNAARIAQSGLRLSEVLQAWGQRHRSEVEFDQSFTEIRPLLASHPENRRLAVTFAETSLRRVNRNKQLPTAEMLTLLNDAKGSLTRIDQPKHTLSRNELRFAIQLHRAIARLQVDIGDAQQEFQEQVEAGRYCDRLLKLIKPKPSDYNAAANVYRAIAAAHFKNSDQDLALELFGKAGRAFVDSADGSRKRKSHVLNHSECYLYAATILAAKGRPEEAANRIRQGIDVLETWGTDEPRDRTIARELGELRMKLGEFESMASK